ncbi:STAS-like domain-containing protein [Desulfovirgula thermocuniculi]|uniref:STAS-like domain-containing protein n=1 Tax=Desulfovirgula thermocuniculi TaxID=348842 RepID=UPI000408EA37|nr:STAS-like domain-containing protein [Desulfovirgula thermocuniculi]
MRLFLGRYGPCLAGRALGREVRERIRETLAGSDRVILDFGGVEVASHGFCDEAFGKLAQEMGFSAFKRAVRFSNCSEDVAAVVRYALRERSRAVEGV